MRDFAADGTDLPDGAAVHAMLFNLLHIENPVGLLREALRVLGPGGSASVIHWRSDIETPRGPSPAIRPSPERCARWAEEAGSRPNPSQNARRRSFLETRPTRRAVLGMQATAFRGSTPIYVFECHSDAIIPWAELRRSRPEPAQLVTFDSHTDTMLPFLRWGFRAAQASGEREPDSRDFIPARVGRVDFANEETIRKAAKDLWHDEHIQAAQETGIVGDAFIVTFGSPPNSPDQRSPRLHYLNGICHHGCHKMPHDEACRIRSADLAIDDQHLVPLFRSNPVAAGVLEMRMPLILDIDLDYFLTEQAFRPNKHTLLSSLAQKADIITIATEPMYVEDCRIDDTITWEGSLARLFSILGATGK